MRLHDRPAPPVPPADRLDLAWAATRPAEPSPELLDALWAHASAELDRIEAARGGDVIPLDERRPARRRRGLVALALAQAAAVLVAAGLAWHHRAAPPRAVDLAEAPAAKPVPSSPVAPPPEIDAWSVVDVPDDTFVVYRIEDTGHRVEEHAQNPLPAGATMHDVVNAMESAAILASAAARDSLGTDGAAIP